MLSSLLLLAHVAVADPIVTIHVERSRIPSGEQIVATVENAMGEPIYVPACETMQVEAFDADQGRWLPTPSQGCKETKVAVALPEGSHTLSASYVTDKFSVVRLVLVFGLRCRDGFALELAGCEELRAATSGNLTVAPPAEQ
ncbi:MAG: hypothetical protein ABIO70_20530 [Pseudomonadota bacterium]